ncbi:MAG: hypothetical protein J5675_06170 [Bacteroidales bacterium]|nr:hypothetical protein [Bacteroidales bacterium]
MFREEFISLLQESVGAERAAIVLKALEEEPSVSIRLNPSKLDACPFPDAVPVPWSPHGFILKERPVFTLDPLFHAGCYYVQESSAMMVGQVFRKILPEFGPGVQVLDLCAAPGGKTTDLAASLRESFGDSFSLLSNEVMRNRYGILRDNVRVWGDPRVGTVSRDPSAFGSEPVFDIVLADVPCSGEGMFRKDPTAVADWTPQLPSFCATRTKRILSDIWPTLREGGILIYSTCTFNHLENADTVDWIASSLGAQVLDLSGLEPAAPIGSGYAMLPGLVPGEGQYVAALRKTASSSTNRHRHSRACPGNLFLHFTAHLPVTPLPPYPSVDVDRATALHYLHGDALRLPSGTPIGLVTICYQGHALGPAKNIGTRCNNLYPKSNRIKMDI